jgi:hypothetical protein
MPGMAAMRDMIGFPMGDCPAETTYVSGWSFGGKWSVSGRLIAVQDLALAQRDLPFVPLRGGPFGQQCGEADDFIATSRSEDVVVLLPGAGLRLGLN